MERDDEDAGISQQVGIGDGSQCRDWRGIGAGTGRGWRRNSFSRRGARSGLKLSRPNLPPKGTEVRIVVADLNDPAAPQLIYDATEGAGVAVDILVNDAGATGTIRPFRQSPVEQETSQVRVNCEAVVRLSRLFIPRMVERRRGWVLVVASTASFQPVPYLSTYAATKAFDRFFALGLAAEMARFGVKVTALCPGDDGKQILRSSTFRMSSSEDAIGGRRTTPGHRCPGER